MQISNRIKGLNPGGDDGWGVFDRARDMVARGIDVAELTIGEHDIGTDLSILQAMDRSARAGHTGYASVPGIGALRDAIAARFQALSGLRVTRDNVAVTPGAQAGLFLSHMLVCDPGDAAMMIDPYYATYPATLRAASARPVIVPARAEAGFQPDAAEIDRAAQASGARSLLINTPNNPTGAVYGPQTLAAIAGVVAARGMWLISDEVYDSQVWTGTHQSPAALPGMAERVLVVGSLSKSHAMTGSRLGWVIGPEAAVSGLHALLTTTHYGLPGFIQEAGLFALTQGADFEAGIAAPFRRRRDRVLALLDGQRVLRAAAPAGAMYVMIDQRATGLSGEAFAYALLEAERVAVMPGESFGQAAAGHVRVALTLPDDRLEDAVARMIRFAAGLVA